MSELIARQQIDPSELKRGRRLKIGAWTAPAVLGGIPAAAFFAIFLIAGSSPSAAFTILFLGILLSVLGLLTGLIISGVLLYRHSAWTSEMRERIAANGIRAEEIEWFAGELRSSEKRALKGLSAGDLLLADAYRETLASRLTATRIIRSAKQELQSTKRRHSKLKQLKSESSNAFRKEIETDLARISEIHDQARQMLAESESRLQMIEAAGARGTTLVGHELALKKLSMRTSELPLALQEARMTRELTDDLNRELEEIELGDAGDEDRSNAQQ